VNDKHLVVGVTVEKWEECDGGSAPSS